MKAYRARSTLTGLAVLSAIWLAGCGSAAADGPLGTLMYRGQVNVSISGGVVGLGQSGDAEVILVNSAHSSIRITGISVVPVPGIPAGRLADAAVLLKGPGVASVIGWPPPDGHRVLEPAVGAVLTHDGYVQIIYGITAPQGVRDFAVAGLRIRYLYGGHAYLAIGWAGNANCEYRDLSRTPANLCTAFIAKVNRVLEQMTGIS